MLMILNHLFAAKFPRQENTVEEIKKENFALVDSFIIT